MLRCNTNTVLTQNINYICTLQYRINNMALYRSKGTIGQLIFPLLHKVEIPQLHCQFIERIRV